MVVVEMLIVSVDRPQKGLLLTLGVHSAHGSLA
jgi:hypothetical protein